MKAIVISRYGGPEVLQLRDVPDPQVKPGQVLVRVEAGGLNFADLLTASGGYPGTPPPPLVAGREFCGRRDDTGERVMGYTQSQAFAEKIAAPQQLLWPVPDAWSAEEGAAFPVNFFTAYFAYWKAGLPGAGSENAGSSTRTPQAPTAGTCGVLARNDTPGKRVLIHAVAGGVGTAAVQIGRVLWVEMFGTSSSDEKLGRVRALGLQHGINYAREDYVASIRELTGGRGVDAVFEMLGGEHVKKSVQCLAWLGCVITYGAATGERPTFDPGILYERQTSVHGLWLSRISEHPETMAAAWKQLSQWIDAGSLKPEIGHALPMDKAADAYRLLSDRANYGKVVIKISR